MTDLDHDEVPALFWWFPNQDDYKPPPPADESTSEKLERISKTIKVETKQKIEIETSLSRFKFFSNISRLPGLRYRRYCTAPIFGLRIK